MCEKNECESEQAVQEEGVKKNMQRVKKAKKHQMVWNEMDGRVCFRYTK